MPVQCKICNQEFQKLITNTHLSKHGITTETYIKEYGKDALSSEEYRSEKSIKLSGKNNPNFGKKMSDLSKKTISEKNIGKSAWNKGIKIENTDAYKEAALKREEKYNTGELQRKIINVSEETKQKISKSIKQYALENPEEMSVRARKAALVKREAGLDLAFFRGKTHSEESKIKISEKSKINAKTKIEKSIQDVKEQVKNYDYEFISYENGYVNAKCKICETQFSYTKQMFTPSKIHNEFCRVCYPRVYKKSVGELEIYEFVKRMFPDTVSGYNFSDRYEIDIYVPSLNIGIEYNGLYWHSEEVLENNGYTKTKDFEKLKSLENSGIRPIFIYEDEWVNNQEIVQNRLSHILGKYRTKIYARKCLIKEISTEQASKFCKLHHIQGHGRSNIRLGLFYQQDLVAVMTFSKNNISRKIKSWELNRFCLLPTYSIPGGASKLLSYFIKNYNPESIVTYADRRWSMGNLYEKMGFKFESFTKPGYWYVKENRVGRIHRFTLRKKPGESYEKTEYQLRKEQGYSRIWDCGNSKWIWTPG